MSAEGGSAPAGEFFSVIHTDDGMDGARVGRIRTDHGAVETPCFLPVASHGDLRAISFEQAGNVGTGIIMANAWHVYRGATREKLRAAGGAHSLMDWNGILMTDSGGYQIFSLSGSSEITDEGVSFHSVESREGGETLTPETVILMQKELGSDIMNVLDDCAPYPCEKQRAVEAVRRTTLWGRISVQAHRRIPAIYPRRQFLYGIVQGSVFEDLRRRSILETAELGFEGYGIGGLSIGMPRSAVREMTALTCAELPQNKPRHLLGVGLPVQILEGISDGVDTFDCVLPIRKGQRGVAYTRFGEIHYKDKEGSRLKDAPLDPKCDCPTCAHYSREQLRVLYRTQRVRAGELAALHNIHFYHKILSGARDAIRAGHFNQYLNDFKARWNCGSVAARAPARKSRPTKFDLAKEKRPTSPVRAVTRN